MLRLNVWLLDISMEFGRPFLICLWRCPCRLDLLGFSVIIAFFARRHPKELNKGTLRQKYPLHDQGRCYGRFRKQHCPGKSHGTCSIDGTLFICSRCEISSVTNKQLNSKVNLTEPSNFEQSYYSTVERPMLDFGWF